MTITITDISSTPPAPRTFTKEELLDGTAPQGIYTGARLTNEERMLCVGADRQDRRVLWTNGQHISGVINAWDFGPFTHHGPIVGIQYDGSKAVR